MARLELEGRLEYIAVTPEVLKPMAARREE